MTTHDLLLVTLGIWLTLLAFASVQAAAELRYRIRCRRRDASRRTQAAAVDTADTPR